MGLSLSKRDAPACSQVLVGLSCPVNGLLDQFQGEKTGTPDGAINELGGLVADLSVLEDMFPALAAGQSKGEKIL